MGGNVADSKTLLVTGGAGFIGSSVVLKALAATDWHVVNVDKLTYSGNIHSLDSVAHEPRYQFIQADVGDARAVNDIFAAVKPHMVMHLAAESHVDRSIDSPEVFIDTNIKGTFVMLEAARKRHKELVAQSPECGRNFRFLHISTDEVFGDLSEAEPDACFSETTPYSPSSPYSASKAASDHLVRAWQRTYGLPALVTNCSNNYGPRQFPEKLIPLVTLNALAGKALPVYGTGSQIRDWLYVEDHAEALLLAISRGKPGETYAVGGHCEKRNIEVVETVCALLDELRPRATGSYADLIAFVQDRPGHDGRYAIDAGKIARELGWKPTESFASGMAKTVRWYLDNEDWWRPILEKSYQMQRLGVNV